MTLEGKARSLFWLLFFGGPRGRVAWAHRGLEFGETGLPATRTRSLWAQPRPVHHAPLCSSGPVRESHSFSRSGPTTPPPNAAPMLQLPRPLRLSVTCLNTLWVCLTSAPRTLSAPRWVRVAVELSSLNLDVAAPWPQPGGPFCDPDADAEVRRGLHLPNVSRPVTTG